MFSVTSTLRLCVALIALYASGTALASAADEDRAYATLLRTINPHLQIRQSLSYAHSLVTDAERSKLDPRLIVALVTVESHWRPNAISPVGARGLGQLMPGTAAVLRVNAWDPAQNIRGAATYLRAMLDHFAASGENRLSFAIGAYNAGPKAVDRYHGIPPYTETQNYVRKVLATFRSIKIRIGAAFAAASVAPDESADAKQWLANADASALAVTAAAAPAAAPAPPAAGTVPADLPPADGPPAP